MSRKGSRLVLVDRDGVINRDSPAYIKSVGEWVPLPGSLEAISRLNSAGYEVAVVTNQSGVGRGLFTARTLDDIHDAMRHAVEAAGGRIAGVFFCPHRPDERCQCRKPKPKLLLDAAEAFGVSIGTVPFIGDKSSDVAAAEAAGAKPVFIGTRDDLPDRPDVPVFPDLQHAVSAFLRDTQRSGDV